MVTDAAPPAGRAMEPQDLSASELEAMLSELLGKYQEPAFQRALQEAYSSCARQKIGLQAALGPLVLSVQKPVLEKYGLPGNASGVDLMKHAVQRRICEGSDAVEDLANQARKALGIEQLPKRQVSAEEQLQRGADETAAKFAGDGQPQLWQQCAKMLEQAMAKGTIPEASMQFLQELLSREAVSVPSILCLFRMAQLGIHVSLLRGLRIPSEVPEVVELPPAKLFFERYALTGSPVVLRGAFSPERFEPCGRLPDFDFLRQKCSHRRVLVKSLGFQDGAGRLQFMTDPELKLPFAAYLEAVERCERGEAAMPYYLGKVPLAAELPELAEEIRAARTDPQQEYGSCFGDLLPEGVFTYFGCGRNTTSVHYDAHENLMICVCGRKRLWLYPPGDARFVYPISKDRGPSMDFSRSSILPFQRFEELSASDRARYPMLANAAGPLEVWVEKGDLFYLPSSWWHCVEGSEERNIILNWWFAMHPEKKQQAFAEQVRAGGYA
ncbi:unnamed protein product [Durusdinium trenchii]|uniref:Bifunctional peptidase and (3S)-lysyl hydroxylase Jmjd7 (JmjC domain-containing protein 7) (Jumonji domain-containing protein 7) (L-lysine (3S)-hydroxylase Jmjd7) n=3 Tax=Durusdinium trenchii TaxID=1381693 RepID=A0ABP0RFF5_9DINO